MLPQNLEIKEEISGRIALITYLGHEVLVVDYSASNDQEMIVSFNYARDFVVNHQKEVRVVSIFNKNYITRKFVNHLEQELGAAEILIIKNAVTGLTDIQQWILRGVNLWTKRKIQNFNLFQDALDYVVSDFE